MERGIMILGSSGAGKSTLGRLVAERLGISFIDIDEYIWRKDTPVPFTAMYPRQEKISRLMDAVKAAGEFVMAGSMDSFHEHFDPFFCLAVYLTAEEKLRVERAHRRELAEFGSRILPGGDMYEEHCSFLKDVAGYDDGTGAATKENHEMWLRQLTCPILRLDGGESLEVNTELIVAAYQS